MVNIMKNKKGWIELIEAAISILLVTIAILVVMNKGSVGNSDISEGVYKTELSILREIETNSTLRNLVLSQSILPVESINADGTINSDFPSAIRIKIDARTPSYLKCIGKICRLCVTETCEDGKTASACNIGETKEIDVYSQSIMVSSDEKSRKLSLFCWRK